MGGFGATPSKVKLLCFVEATLAKFPKEGRGVLATEAEAVDEDAINRLVGACGVWDVVQVAVGVWRLKIDRGRNRSCLNRLDRGEAGNSAGASQQVADHALW